MKLNCTWIVDPNFRYSFGNDSSLSIELYSNRQHLLWTNPALIYYTRPTRQVNWCGIIIENNSKSDKKCPKSHQEVKKMLKFFIHGWIEFWVRTITTNCKLQYFSELNNQFSGLSFCSRNWKSFLNYGWKIF